MFKATLWHVACIVMRVSAVSPSKHLSDARFTLFPEASAPQRGDDGICGRSISTEYSVMRASPFAACICRTRGCVQVAPSGENTCTYSYQ